MDRRCEVIAVGVCVTAGGLDVAAKRPPDFCSWEKLVTIVTLLGELPRQAARPCRGACLKFEGRGELPGISRNIRGCAATNEVSATNEAISGIAWTSV